MKKFCLFLVLSLFCLQSEGQVYAGQSAVGFRVDTLNIIISSPNDSSVNQNLFFTCDTLISANVLSYDATYIQQSTGSLRGDASSYIILIDTTIQMGAFIDIIGAGITPSVELFAVQKLTVNTPINSFSNFSWYSDTSILLSRVQHGLNTFYQYGFNSKYIPLRKKYGDEYLYGWLLVSAVGRSASIYSLTKFPQSLTVLYDTLTCNSSFTFADGFVMNNIYQDTVYDFALPSSTLGCDSLVRTKLHVDFQNFATHYDTVCIGTNYTFIDGSSQVVTSNPTIHLNIFRGVNGCDSIIETNICIKQLNQSTVNVNINCGTDFMFPDSTIINNALTDTSHISYLQTQYGCDSTVITNIHINSIFHLTENVNINCGADFMFPDSTIINNIFSDTAYTSHFYTHFGCDSLVTTNIHLFPIYSTIKTIGLCPGESYMFPDSTIIYNIIKNTNHTSYLKSNSGCDSIIKTQINIIIVFNNVLEPVQLCKGYDYMFPDSTYIHNIQNDTIQTSHFISRFGCDSSCKTTIYVNPIVNNTENINICNGSNYTFPDLSSINNVKQNITHISHFYTFKNCDSIITTNLIIDSINNYIRQSDNYLISSNENATYQWFDCETQKPIEGENRKEFLANKIGNYFVLINEGECIYTSDCYYVDYINTDNFYYFDFYPNPSSSKITILELIGDAINCKRELFNSLGQLIISTKENEIDVSYLPKGVYYLKIANQAKKVLVQ